MRDGLDDTKLDSFVCQQPEAPAIAPSWRFGAGQGDQVSFGAPLQRALVDPIGLRAFQRGLQTSLVEAFARPLYGGRRRLQHLGDLTIDECLLIGMFADLGLEQDASTVQFTCGSGASRDELVQVLALFLG